MKRAAESRPREVLLLLSTSQSGEMKDVQSDITQQSDVKFVNKDVDSSESSVVDDAVLAFEQDRTLAFPDNTTMKRNANW